MKQWVESDWRNRSSVTPSTHENVATAGEDGEAEGEEERSVTESRENSSCSSFFKGEASIAGANSKLRMWRYVCVGLQGKLRALGFFR